MSREEPQVGGAADHSEGNGRAATPQRAGPSEANIGNLEDAFASCQNLKYIDLGKTKVSGDIVVLRNCPNLVCQLQGSKRRQTWTNCTYSCAHARTCTGHVDSATH